MRTRALTILATTSLLLLAATPAWAAPSLSTAQVGALPVDPAISNPPNHTFPVSAKLSGCAYANVTGPAGQVIKHVAPCQTGAGDGSAANPWRRIQDALSNLNPGEVAYVHDDPASAVDYRESNLTTGRGGTGASSRIVLMAAPGESPQLAKSTASGTSTQPILHLDDPWWIIDGLRIDGSGLALSAQVVRVRSEYNIVRRLTTRNSYTTKSVVAFDGARNSALLDSISPTNPSDPNYGLGEAVDANNRPVNVPAAGSGDFTDHHGITALNGASKILIRNNHSYGHNGDSFQCGEENSTATVIPTDITLENNRFHHDEENAIDLKACHRVTIRNNKMFGYRPARPADADGTQSTRAPQGDAIVIHAAGTGRPADRVLVELNRLWDNSRAINLAPTIPTAVVRRNLVFNSSTAFCGIGAGLLVRGQNIEVYHNTLDTLPASTGTPAGCDPWSTSDKAAVRIAPNTGARVVLWNNIVSNATYPYSQSGSFTLDATKNLFHPGVTGAPPNSIVGDPQYVSDPLNNDYYTRQGSPARDAATAVPAGVSDPRAYCDDPSPGEPDTIVEPDIGFLESCS